MNKKTLIGCEGGTRQYNSLFFCERGSKICKKKDLKPEIEIIRTALKEKNTQSVVWLQLYQTFKSVSFFKQRRLRHGF